MYYRRSRASSRGSVFDLLNTPTNCTLSVSAPGSRRGSKPSISIEQEPDPESYGKQILGMLGQCDLGHSHSSLCNQALFLRSVCWLTKSGPVWIGLERCLKSY